jgi:chemotaxis protein MotB
MAEASLYQKKKKKVDEDVGPDKDAWMVTFGDLLQLLITFFVLMISMSTMDKKVFKEMFSIYGGGLGVLGFTEMTQIVPSPISPMISPPRFAMESFRRFLLTEKWDLSTKKPVPKDFDKLVNSLLIAGVQIEKRGKDYSMVLAEESAFRPGSAQISDKMKPKLDWIASILKFSKNRIIVEGHTDNLPYRSRVLLTNWELSTARAAAVFIYLVNQGNIEPERIEAKGFASYRPKVGNISEAYRKRNRRIEIVIKQFEKGSF